MVYTQWKYRARIAVNNPVNIADYQINVVIPYRVHMNSNFSDIRFSDINGIELNYWIESYTSFVSATIWVKCPTNCSEFYLYYGNSIATTTSNGTNTFDFFDDFSGSSIDASKWTSVGNVTVSNSNVVISSYGSVNSSIRSSSNPFIGNTNMYARIKTDNFDSFLWGETAFGADSSGAGDIAANYNHRYPQGKGIYIYGSGVTIIGWSANIWHTQKLTRVGTNAFWLVDNNNLKSNTGVSSSSLNIWSRQDYNTNPSRISIDWVFINKYAALEPTTTISQTNINPFHRRINRIVIVIPTYVTFKPIIKYKNPDKIKITNQSDKIKITNQSDKIKITNKADKIKITNKADKIKITNKADKIKITNKADKIKIINKADKIKIINKADKIKIKGYEN